MAQLLADKRIAYVLLIGGIVLALLSILIDPIRGYDIYLAGLQVVALVVGIVAALAGAFLVWRGPA